MSIVAHPPHRHGASPLVLEQISNSIGRAPDESRGELSSYEFSLQNLKTGLPLAAADGLSVISGITFVVLFAQLFGIQPAFGVQFVFGSVLGLVATFLISGLYPACGMSEATEFRKVITTGAMVQAASFTAIAMTNTLPLLQLFLVSAAFSLSIALLPVFRSTARRLCSQFDWWTQPVLIVGDGKQDHALFEALSKEVCSGLRPVGIVRGTSNSEKASGSDDRYLGGIQELASLIRGQHCHRLFVAEGVAGDISKVLSPGSGAPHVHVLSRPNDAPTLWCESGERMGRTETHYTDWLLLPTSRMVKRGMDVALILLSSPVLVPVMLTLAAMVKLTSKGPVFYCQRRLANRGEHFFAWKFRSMVVNADEALNSYLNSDPELRAEWERDHKLKNDPRVTWIGKILRKTSLDELPQIWNVFIGEMSLVGPRPIVDDEIEKYGDVYELYKLVRPGITGLWQISGRNNTTYAERLSYDRYYVRNWSPWLDLFILLRTVKTVLLREGAY